MQSSTAPRRGAVLPALVGALVTAALVSGCGAAAGSPGFAPRAAAPRVLAPTEAASPGAGELPILPDTRTADGLDAAFTARGVPLINKNHPVSAAHKPKLGKAYQLTPEADAAFGRLVRAGKAAGVQIVWRVGYRSYAHQQRLTKSPPKAYSADPDAYVAAPGTSEHQAGLAVDVGSKQGLGAAFATTKEFRWLRAHAHEYGFILRYPEGKTHLTGFHYEPWHYRYVGPQVAAAFGPNSSLTLEEYLGGR